MSVFSKITSKGQTTIPIDVRERLGLKEGDQISFIFAKDGSIKIEKRASALDVLGTLYDPDRKPISVEEMNEASDKAMIEDWEEFDRS